MLVDLLNPKTVIIPVELCNIILLTENPAYDKTRSDDYYKLQKAQANTKIAKITADKIKQVLACNIPKPLHPQNSTLNSNTCKQLTTSIETAATNAVKEGI